jgi:hypothetical protein
MSEVTISLSSARRGQSEALGAAPAALVEPTWLEAGCLNLVIHPAALTLFILYFPNKTRRICSGSSSYNIGLLLGPEVSLKAFVAVVMIFRISCGECSSRFSKRQPDMARVRIRRAVN